MTTIPTLTTERLTLRAPAAGDFPALAAFFASDRAAFVGGPMSEELTWRHLASEIGHWHLRGYGRWMVDVTATGQTVGMIGLWNPHGWPEAEIGWDLFEGFEGKGYATEAAAAARQFAYEVLGWSTVISLVKPANTASAAVARRLGCMQDGDFTHERHGFMNIYRHPSAADLAAQSTDGGPEAYA